MNEAFATNDSHKISAYLSEDWILLEPQYGIISKESFLRSIEQGELSHTAMKKNVISVKPHDNFAIVTTRGRNIGSFKNEPFNSEQWVTNIYIKESDHWICVMTQEAPVTCK